MNIKLLEILRGSLKGLAGTACCIPFGLGLPTADELYKSINSREGKIAYNIASVALIASAFGAIYSIGD